MRVARLGVAAILVATGYAITPELSAQARLPVGPVPQDCNRACLEGLARVAASQGRPERAARLLGASAALRHERNTSFSPIVQSDHDHASKTAREALGAKRFSAEWTVGHAMTLEDAIAEALDNDV